jgi:hypothetical protein
MVDTLLACLFGGVGGIATVGALHLIRVVGNPLRIRRAAPPLDLSRYRVPPQE